MEARHLIQAQIVGTLGIHVSKFRTLSYRDLIADPVSPSLLFPNKPHLFLMGSYKLTVQRDIHFGCARLCMYIFWGVYRDAEDKTQGLMHAKQKN